ncbi:MAG: DEAD/DEAH box helicase family protein [Bacteroidales bacterium]|nr:DEAD/DEAH box helicase family protein [Bacteroidales bacterium]
MTELQIQETYVKDFLSVRSDGLNYNWITANQVNPETHIIESELKEFLSNATFNKEAYSILLRKYKGDEQKLIQDFSEDISKDYAKYQNAAIFFNKHKNYEFKGLTFVLFAPSGSELHKDDWFDQNIFSVVEEYTFKEINFRPDLCFFLNGIFIGYSELKSNLSNQYAKTNGRKKVIKDFCNSVGLYSEKAADNDKEKSLERKMLFPFVKSIHITTTDLYETYVMRNIMQYSGEIRIKYNENKFNPELAEIQKSIENSFKPYPLLSNRGSYNPIARFEEIMTALYSKKNIEKEILYYNFIMHKMEKDSKGNKVIVGDKNGWLISPRPKQKFGTDKIVAKIPEFLKYERDPEYFYKKLENRLRDDGVNEIQIQEAIEKRKKYQNNKNVYSLLLQYAAGFGKSNIIGWTALQLKDMRDDNHKFVYDKIMVVVDRLQLRDQLDTTLRNMNIQKGMFVEATNAKTFKNALKSDKRIVIVNIQKFGAADSESAFLDKEALKKLAEMRVVFLIDEIHRTNTGDLHDDMLSVFDELQSAFDNSEEYTTNRTKKNLIIGFTATPSDNTLARFGEFAKYQESEIKWVPFDSYSMREAIQDGFILDPTKGIIPVAAKMFFEEPDDDSLLFNGKTYDQLTPQELEQLYRIRKEKIYSNPERIEAISKFIIRRLLENVYPQIKGEAKAMLAVSSIPNAITYHQKITKLMKTEGPKYKNYERFKDAPIYIVYSERQDVANPDKLNGGIDEQNVIKNFKSEKNGLIIVVDKLQTGFDEAKLHTLFLDKEIRGINAIQTICRVNRICKNKTDCKIIDFSHLNCNVANIRKAFAKYADMVVSEFNPFESEKVMKNAYNEMCKSEVYKQFKNTFNEIHHEARFEPIAEYETNVKEWICENLENEKATQIYKVACSFFRNLALLQYVLEINAQYKNRTFAEFWDNYGRLYREVTKVDNPEPEDINIYFDNTIGMLETDGEEDADKPRSASENSGGGRSGKGSNKQAIIERIRKLNEKELEIEKLIKQFEDNIKLYFDYIESQPEGQRLIAKIRSKDTSFSNEELLHDFNSITRKFCLVKSRELLDLFKKEVKENLDSFFNLFVEERCENSGSVFDLSGEETQGNDASYIF